jgi:ubiquinone biosynthesis protein
MKSGLRAWRIGRVLVRYRLDDLLEQPALERWLRLMRPFVPRASPDIAALPRGARLRLALQELGPIFVKFGQILSTRRDLVPADVAQELTLLQDRVAPFDGDTARVLVEQALGLSIGNAFARFDTTPLASASIAQVHAATLHASTSPGSSDAAPREVVVKVLRPGIKRQIAADVALLKTIAALVDRAHPAADKIRPREIVAEIESTLAAELDLQREGANASVLRRFWLDSPDLYVPEVVWSHTAERVLTLERVHGIPSDDIIALDAAGIDRKVLAAKGVRVFYTQVFRDNFFHADAHAGNIWVDIDPMRKSNPRFIALDFGIMGQLSSEDQYYLAENFMAIFNRDYRRIAELHVQAGWMPSHIRIDELEAAARSVCEPYFTRPLSEISLAEVLLKLFRIARPVLERILMDRYSPQRLFSEFRKRLPEMITQAPDMPRLLHAWLTQQVEGKQQLHMHSRQLDDIADATRLLQRRTVCAILGTGLLIVAAVLYALHAGGPLVGGIPAATWIAGLGGVWALLAAWPRREKTHSR